MENADCVVHKTTKYDSFSFLIGNRNIRERHVKKLMNSISEKNMLSENPIIVSKDMRVIDGQHRLEAAKRLGVPIYYMVTPIATIEDVRLLNVNVAGWKVQDYLDSYVSQNYPDYFVLDEFCKTYAIPVTIGLRLLNGRGESEKLREEFKTGEFKVTTPEQAKEVAHKLCDIREYVDRGIYRSRDFILAVVYLHQSNLVNHAKLIEKFKLSGMTIYRQGSARDYLRRLEEVYNFRSKRPVRFF